jgi:hypothetical protein
MSSATAMPRLHVAGHHVGLRNALHQKPHQHALCAHRHGGKQAGDDAVPVVGTGDGWVEQDDGDEDREQRGLERQHPRQRRAPGIAGETDQRGGDRRGGHESDDGDELAGDTDVVADQFGTGDHKAAGHLRGKQAEQRQVRIAIDIAGDKAQQRRHDRRERLVAMGPDLGHGSVPRVMPGLARGIPIRRTLSPSNRDGRA